MASNFLEGNKILLRSITEKDLTPEYRDWFNDAEVCQFNAHHRFPKYNEDMERYFNNVIQTKENLVLAIINKAFGKHVGNISLQGINYIDRSAELAIIIGDKESWGQGIGQESGTLMVKHAFAELNLHRLYCGTSAENAGMIKLAKNLGFKTEGVQREALFKNGSFHDIHNFGLLQNEYEK